MKIKPLSRRTLLQSAAGLGLTLPALEAMGQAAMTPPRRLITVFTANGDQTSRRMTNRSETGFVFDEMLTPFERYRQDVLVLEGIDKFHDAMPDAETADRHQQGGSALAPWRSGTGSFPIGGGGGRTIGYVKGPSIDKALGDAIAATNPNLRSRYLYFRVGDNSNNIWNTHAHNGPEGMQSPISAETNPFNAYMRIFAGVDTASQQMLARRLAMRQSALDLVKGELSSLRAKVSAADKARLDLHAESLQEVERGLMTMVPTGGACTTLALGNPYNTLDPLRWRDVGNLFFKISAMALACDVTRVINFNWSGNTSDRTYSTLQYNGASIAEGHHTISHNDSGNTAVTFDKIRLIKRLLFEASTQLHEDLKALPDGTGKTLWDHTLVVHWSELSQGDTHAVDNDLVVLAGKAHGHFRMGRYLNLAGRQKRGFSNLLVSCWQYMGFNRDTWGAPELFGAGTGGLPV